MHEKIDLFIRGIGSTEYLVQVREKELWIPYNDIKNETREFYKKLYDCILYHCKEVNLQGCILATYTVHSYSPNGEISEILIDKWDRLFWVTPDFEWILHSEEAYINYCSDTRVVAQFDKVSFYRFMYDTREKFNDSRISSDEYLNSCYHALKLPRRATKGSAGYDFFSPFDINIKPNETVAFPTGIRCKMNNNVVLQLYPRSSLGFKYKMTLDNTVGIIDSDYYNSDNEGHIQVKVTNRGDKPIHIKKGEAYMQGVFTKYYLAVEKEVTKERNGGIGSTNE